MNTSEKMLGIITDGQERKIVVTHVTIRQSIFFLVLRLIFLETIAAAGIIIFHTILLSTNILESFGGIFRVLNTPFFVVLVLAKTITMILVIIQWLYEYYEITPNVIVYKKGFIFKREQRTTLDHLGSCKLEQGILGRIFSYGTLRLYNWVLDKDFTLYLIHNPLKYHHILQTILPKADEEKQIVREHILEPEVI